MGKHAQTVDIAYGVYAVGAGEHVAVNLYETALCQFYSGGVESCWQHRAAAYSHHRHIGPYRGFTLAVFIAYLMAFVAYGGDFGTGYKADAFAREHCAQAFGNVRVESGQYFLAVFDHRHVHSHGAENRSEFNAYYTSADNHCACGELFDGEQLIACKGVFGSRHR